MYLWNVYIKEDSGSARPIGQVQAGTHGEAERIAARKYCEKAEKLLLLKL